MMGPTFFYTDNGSSVPLIIRSRYENRVMEKLLSRSNKSVRLNRILLIAVRHTVLGKCGKSFS